MPFFSAALPRSSRYSPAAAATPSKDDDAVCHAARGALICASMFCQRRACRRQRRCLYASSALALHLPRRRRVQRDVAGAHERVRAMKEIWRMIAARRNRRAMPRVIMLEACIARYYVMRYAWLFQHAVLCLMPCHPSHALLRQRLPMRARVAQRCFRCRSIKRGGAVPPHERHSDRAP